ncbi:MAG: DUF3105 domain-containing protein [Nocardioides sp.]|nr:DUF3105 domain-containing protein [Nocardioides sp.]
MRVALAVVLAVLVVAGAATVPMLLRDGSGPVALMGPANGADSTSTDRGVREYDVGDKSHTSDEVDYPQSPPVGGQHDPEWEECGVYERPLREENVVHALEHGTVWITYQSNLSGVDVAALADILPDEGILSPYDDQDAPVVITVWGRQLSLDGVNADRLNGFVDDFGHGETAPEPMASCHGGVEEYDDGEPA